MGKIEESGEPATDPREVKEMGDVNMHDLDRFKKAQERDYSIALDEICKSVFEGKPANERVF